MHLQQSSGMQWMGKTAAIVQHQHTDLHKKSIVQIGPVSTDSGKGQQQ
jgi:hypothetical protein